METLAGSKPPSVYVNGRRFTSESVQELAHRFGHGLLRHGIHVGDKVLFQVPPCLEAVIAFHGCWSIGAVAVPVHHRFSPSEVRTLMARLSPKVALFGPEQVNEVISDAIAQTVHVEPTSPAVILATSGSSGIPKLVIHSHAGLAYKGSLMATVHGLTSDDVVLMPAPMGHISGLLSGVLVPGAAGMAATFMKQWDAAAALDRITRLKVTFMVGPPVYFSQLARTPSFSPVSVGSLRLISCGGTDVTTEFARHTAQALTAVVKRTYGSTEAPSVSTSHAEDPPERGWSTDGRPTGSAELQVDPVSGELLVRGPELFKGYHDREGTQQGVDEDGWFRTGDRASIDGGWLTILGRLTDLLIRGGENVDPREVESVCAEMVGVEQAVVVGYPDEDMGERVGVVLVADRRIDLSSVRNHCSACGLARYKTPERVLQLDEVPLLSFGKPDRAALRELFLAR